MFFFYCVGFAVCVKAVLMSGAPGQPAPGTGAETSELMHHRHPFRVRVLPVSDTPNFTMQHVCLGCGKADGSKLLRCARCNVAYYCSKQCQVAHWGAHKSECAPQSTFDKDVRKMATRLFREARDAIVEDLPNHPANSACLLDFESSRKSALRCYVWFTRGQLSESFDNAEDFAGIMMKLEGNAQAGKSALVFGICDTRARCIYHAKLIGTSP